MGKGGEGGTDVLGSGAAGVPWLRSDTAGGGGNRDTPHGEPPPPGNVLARQRRPRPRPRSVFASTMESTGRGEGRVDEAKLTAEDPWCETETQRDRQYLQPCAHLDGRLAETCSSLAAALKRDSRKVPLAAPGGHGLTSSPRRDEQPRPGAMAAPVTEEVLVSFKATSEAKKLNGVYRRRTDLQVNGRPVYCNGNRHLLFMADGAWVIKEGPSSEEGAYVYAYVEDSEAQEPFGVRRPWQVMDDRDGFVVEREGLVRSELLLHLWNFGHFMRKAAEDAYSQGNHQWIEFCGISKSCRFAGDEMRMDTGNIKRHEESDLVTDTGVPWCRLDTPAGPRLGGERFEPNPFKIAILLQKESCKHCGRPWTEHDGVISEDIFEGYLQALRKAADAWQREAADPREECCFYGDEPQRGPSGPSGPPDHDDFQMMSPTSLANLNAQTESAREVPGSAKVYGFIDFSECNVASHMPSESPSRQTSACDDLKAALQEAQDQVATLTRKCQVLEAVTRKVHCCRSGAFVSAWRKIRRLHQKQPTW
ncbi:Hypothetical protein SCF082_LOCUS32284 [Durusdinium trenchii]|uniref:Uncharacterized protein n=1 Tax=Durusdinium trenchii TaxID=1381693 RepID=A0ABP0ND72_9DINO